MKEKKMKTRLKSHIIFGLTLFCLILPQAKAWGAHIAVGLEHPDIKNRAAAEVSGDAEVSAYDAALIAQRAVGLIDKFPVE